jgi:hypothetical protein
MKVMIRVPTSARVSGAMTQWLIWAAREQPEWDISLSYTASFGMAAGRNAMTRELLKSDCSHLWMLDADTVPPNSFHLMDHAESYPILCGPYVGCREGKTYWMVYNEMDGKYTPIPRKKWPAERIFRAAAAGGGCMLIKRDVFEKLGPDPWEYIPNEDGTLGSEDFAFCKSIGGCYVDSHYSCRHYRETDLLDVMKHAQVS